MSSSWPQNGMSFCRWLLCVRTGAELYEEEIDAGWYYCKCGAWDGMLIHEDWKEAEVCSCKDREEIK